MSDFIALGHETAESDLEALDMLGAMVAARFGESEPRAAMEVGSWTGRTALVLAPHFDQLFCCDTFLGTPTDRMGELAALHGRWAVFAAFCRNAGPLLGTVIYPCWGPSRTWADAWTRPLELLFIDASHTYRDCGHDIRDWGRHVRPGGIVCVHDYGAAGFEGVTRAVDELLPGRKVLGASVAYAEVG